MKNKYGLSRRIPEEVKREVRKKSGFGCVRCGSVPYDYEHVIPEFHEAREHNSDKITLLCGSCHDKVTRKIISKCSIQQNMLNPYNLQKNEIKGYELEIIPSLGDFTVKLGNVTAINTKNFLCVDNEALLSFSKGEGNEMCILNANFKDKRGNSILRIVNNEWYSSILNWDMECIGTRIKIRETRGKYSLIFNKKDNYIDIEYINIKHRGVKIFFDGKNGGEFTYNNSMMVFEDLVYKNSTSALRFENNLIILHSNGCVTFKGIRGYRV